jgi:hypothetical protein
VPQHVLEELGRWDGPTGVTARDSEFATAVRPSQGVAQGLIIAVIPEHGAVLFCSRREDRVEDWVMRRVRTAPVRVQNGRSQRPVLPAPGATSSSC